MQTYRGTSRAKRYKPNQQDRCTYSSRVQNSSRSHRTSSRDQPGQAIPPTAVASRQSWRSRYTLYIGNTNSYCLLVAPPPIISIMFTSFSCLVSTNCLPPPAADEGTRPSSARSSRFFLYICQFLFIFVNLSFFNLQFFYIFQDMEQ